VAGEFNQRASHLADVLDEALGEVASRRAG
jgi:hypothetical protein